jgi:hypothetical protein
MRGAATRSGGQTEDFLGGDVYTREISGSTMRVLATCFPTQSVASSVDISDTQNEDSSKIFGRVALGGTVSCSESAKSRRERIRELEAKIRAQEHQNDVNKSGDRACVPVDLYVSSPPRPSQSTDRIDEDSARASQRWSCATA